jgi:hypothetical protein
MRHLTEGIANLLPTKAVTQATDSCIHLILVKGATACSSGLECLHTTFRSHIVVNLQHFSERNVDSTSAYLVPKARKE